MAWNTKQAEFHRNETKTKNGERRTLWTKLESENWPKEEKVDLKR